MSKLVDTCPPTALGLTFKTSELSEGSDHAVGLEDHLQCEVSCVAILHSSERGDLEIQSTLGAPGPYRSRDGNQYEYLNMIITSPHGRGALCQSIHLG